MSNEATNELYKETFLFVPSHIVDLPGMTIGRLKFYSAIFQLWHKNMPCFLSNDILSERSGLKKTQIIEAFLYFEKHNCLSRVQKGSRRYIVQPTLKIESYNSENNQHTGLPVPCSINTQGTGLPVVGYRSTGMQGTGEPVHNIKKINIKKLNKKEKEVIDPNYQYPETYFQMAEIQMPNEKQVSTNTKTSFDVFWSIYPVKKGEHRARQQWIHDGCDQISDQIIEKLKQQIARDKAFKDGFIPNPQKYLCEKRFEDEVQEIKKGHYDYKNTEWASSKFNDIFDEIN